MVTRFGTQYPDKKSIQTKGVELTERGKLEKTFFLKKVHVYVMLNICIVEIQRPATFCVKTVAYWWRFAQHVSPEIFWQPRRLRTAISQRVVWLWGQRSWSWKLQPLWKPEIGQHSETGGHFPCFFWARSHSWRPINHAWKPGNADYSNTSAAVRS